jgi:Hemerythrin
MSNHRSAEELLGILHKLRDYTSTHFRDEEKRFVHTEYPAVKDHLLIHREFEAKVDEVERGIKQGTVTLSMHESDPFGAGPTGCAIRDNEAIWSDNSTADSRLVPWWQLIQKTGFLSVGALPLRQRGEVLGNMIPGSCGDICIPCRSPIPFAAG